MTWWMRGGILNVGLLRTDKKEKKFGGSRKTHKRIRKYFKISSCKPEVRDGFGYLGTVESLGIGVLKGRGRKHSDLSHISVRKDTLASLKKSKLHSVSLPGRNFSSICVVGSF
jgi:hypothetical protein